ncbi:hypothetical protein [Chondromyces apiculatus]|uniref:hypothetical protein n=1 Tax=Chondromyces apiculatus TaxID=51 RepID=UPI0018CC430F|nr:hypothetical protein [Chondromyces apiculatus]
MNRGPADLVGPQPPKLDHHRAIPGELPQEDERGAHIQAERTPNSQSSFVPL